MVELGNIIYGNFPRSLWRRFNSRTYLNSLLIQVEFKNDCESLIYQYTSSI